MLLLIWSGERVEVAERGREMEKIGAKDDTREESESRRMSGVVNLIMEGKERK